MFGTAVTSSMLARNMSHRLLQCGPISEVAQTNRLCASSGLYKCFNTSKTCLHQTRTLMWHSMLKNSQFVIRTPPRTVTRLLGVFGLENGLLKVRLPECVGSRLMATAPGKGDNTYHRRTGLIYLCAAGVFMLGMSYAGVPLYRMFCQATGLGGIVSRGHDTSKVETMQTVPERVIRVRFNADVASSMRWNFRPQQTEVKVSPGETALAFYTARN